MQTPDTNRDPAAAHGAASQPPIDRRVIPPAAVETRWAAEDGHQIRRIDWPGIAQVDNAAPRGSILFMPGRGDNYEKYLESLEQWHRAGWRVTASDWRGQAASGRLGNDQTTGHIGDFGDWVDDLDHLWSQWIKETPAPHILIGHSMGGHLVLRAVAEGRVDPDAVALSAPMLGFFGNMLPTGIMHRASKVIAGFGDRKRPAWKWSEKPGEMPAGRLNLLTHDRDRYEDELYWRDTRPELVMGAGSWGWVERAYASMRGLYRDGVLEGVATPILLLGTSHDKLVDMKQIVRAAERLPNAQLLAFGSEAHHEILREADPVRDRAMAAIADFLDREAPAR